MTSEPRSPPGSPTEARADGPPMARWEDEFRRLFAAIEPLPQRALVAVIVRFNRRVRPLVIEGIDRSIEAATRFALDPDAPPPTLSRSRKPSVDPAEFALEADDAAASVGFAADAAHMLCQSWAGVGGRIELREAVWADLDRLRRMGLRHAPGANLGPPVDPSEAGPLGPLWPAGRPAWWYSERVNPTVPAPADSPSPSDERDVLADWQWVHNEISAGRLDDYADRFVAAYQRKVVGHDTDRVRLELDTAKRFDIHPDRVVITYVG